MASTMMATRIAILVLILACTSALLLQKCDALITTTGSRQNLARRSTETTSLGTSKPLSCLFSASTQSSNEQEMGEMRADIARMKEEALRRLEALNQKLEAAQMEHEIKEQQDKPFSPVIVDADEDDPRVKELVDMAEHFDREMQQPKTNGHDVVFAKGTNDIVHAETLAVYLPDEKAAPAVTSTTATSKSIAAASGIKHKQHPLKLLDGTRWRLMLNVGREPGTWMPKTWGASGERLYLNLEMEFTDEQLYERDDFFNGVSGSKVLHVIHNEGSLAPSMEEGGRRVRVANGGWRVVPNEGPLGTTVLRFYFDLEEETRHSGSDVYLPRGRIYCTCGYFPMAGRSGGHSIEPTKEALQKELHELEARYAALQTETELDESLISFEGLKRAKEMMEIRVEADKINKALQEARVKEPERALLRLSQDRSVGLTREGGVCCKEEKGVAVEYHILGHFEVASMENREHADYRELLP